MSVPVVSSLVETDNDGMLQLRVTVDDIQY